MDKEESKISKQNLDFWQLKLWVKPVVNCSKLGTKFRTQKTFQKFIRSSSSIFLSVLRNTESLKFEKANLFSAFLFKLKY